MALRPKTRHKRARLAKSFRRMAQRYGLLDEYRASHLKSDEPGRMERLAEGKITPAKRAMECLKDRQHYRQVVLERMAGRNHGHRSRMLRDRLVMVNAQIRDLRRELDGGLG